MRRSFIITWLISLANVATLPAQSVDFNRDIRPIFSENCFKCHGPDDNARKAKFRVDLKDKALSHPHAIKPGKPGESELFLRVSSTEESELMPPANSGKKLTSAQVDLLKRWIAEGAPWSEHWAFVSPVRSPIPTSTGNPGGSNAIDRFLLQRMKKSGLNPSPEASRHTLIRRLTLDLTGLPPTPEEVAAFINDASPLAYERLVDRLLNSPRYGERLALDWLDAARFADTHGYHIDSGRDMTRWREYIIRAFNFNLPFDRFTIEQLAGDLLPGATVEQQIASGFNRNHMINFEGGAIPAEYLNAYIVDRVNTTGTVWLGMTVGCAQCHDHKYDPFSQKDFYKLYAFFHNVPENGLDGSKGNAMPLIRVPDQLQKGRLELIAQEIAEINKKLELPSVETSGGQLAWEAIAGKVAVDPWQTRDLQVARSSSGADLEKTGDGSLRVTGPNPAKETYTLGWKQQGEAARAVRIEFLPDPKLSAGGPGRSENGNLVLSEVKLKVNGKPGNWNKATAGFSQSGFPAEHAIDNNPRTGWAIYPEVGKPHWLVLTPAAGALSGDIQVDLVFASIYEKHQAGRIRLSTTTSTPQQLDNQPPKLVQDALAKPREKRSAEDNLALRKYYREQIDPTVSPLQQRLGKLKQDQEGIEKTMATAMVMQELAAPRETFALVRGEYDKKGEKVFMGTPSFLPPLPEDAPKNRLGLARWLTSQSHPLTARVAVNRFWQTFFGIGLVKTPEDFGSQGEWPSHPELLDWLAVEFIESGWDVRHLVRLMLTSSTYRQSSVASEIQLKSDPENRLLSRMSRPRLQAEFLRDQALAVSGLLENELGGKSVNPYQPPGIWEELASRADGKNWTAQAYEQSHGHDLYRRTMYTFWKRTAPPPTLSALDAPDRETCTVRRARTNTPLQALILMNDPTYVEAARKAAERILAVKGDEKDKVAFAFMLFLSRPAQAKELQVVEKFYRDRLADYKIKPEKALKLLSIGEAPRDETMDVAELAAWTMVVNMFLNLDEALTRG
ncbi:MAG: DUF1553 domain-containing protein [Gemmataceae bacterium]|nr:DUF1553 domain-containing protein [Gemmataceae bacterium]